MAARKRSSTKSAESADKPEKSETKTVTRNEGIRPPKRQQPKAPAQAVGASSFIPESVTKWLKDFDIKNLTFGKVLKLVGIALVILIAVMFALSVIGSVTGSLFGLGSSSHSGFSKASHMGGFGNVSYPHMAPARNSGSSSGGYAGSGWDWEEEVAAEMDTMLSTRNVAGSDIAPIPEPIPPIDDGYTAGNTAEDFEIKEYYGTIKTRRADRACDQIEAFKALSYVVFENSNRGDESCNYRFKVENRHADEILSIIERLEPEELNANIHTIKRQIDDYTSREEILKNKLEALENVLEKAQTDYDEIAELAAEESDIESLSKIIDSRVALVERLTNQRLKISAELDRLSRSKADQLDRITYTYFNINVYEFKIISFKQLKNDWVRELQSMFRNINEILQGVTTSFIVVVGTILQYALYLLLILIVVKYGWRLARRIWKA